MNLLPLVLAGHLVGDWIVQTDKQAANKTTSWTAMGRHLLGYHLTLAGFAVFAIHTWPAFFALAISAATHGFIDRRWPVKWLMQVTGSAPFAETTWGVLVVDQALHLSILCVLVACVAR